MPGPSWRDVQRRQAPARAPAPAPAPVPGRVEPPGLADLPEASSLGRLMAERQALEQRMQTLTGEAPPDPRTAALYQVRPMAERRAEHDAWQTQREREGRRALAGLADRRRAGEDLREPRVAQGGEEQPEGVGEPSLRPTRGELGPPLRGTAADRARRRTGAVAEEGRSGLSALRDKLGSLDRSLADADRQLAAEGMNREREDLARMKKEMGLDRILSGAGKLDSMLERGAPSSKAPERAERVIEDDWLKRRDAVGGPDMESYQRGFKERAARLFGVDTGTIDQLQERMQKLREASLDRKREQKEQEQRDEERRSAAEREKPSDGTRDEDRRARETDPERSRERQEDSRRDEERRARETDPDRARERREAAKRDEERSRETSPERRREKQAQDKRDEERRARAGSTDRKREKQEEEKRDEERRARAVQRRRESADAR